MADTQRSRLELLLGPESDHWDPRCDLVCDDTIVTLTALTLTAFSIGSYASRKMPLAVHPDRVHRISVPVSLPR
jgi:hypothetical protein